ncbi:MAG: hypothetical protein WDN75_15905 [Bacteroidota bacterium]
MRRIIVYSLLGLITIFFGGRAFIFFKIKQAIVEKIDTLRADGIIITYSSLSVNSFSGNVSFKEVEVKSSVADSVCTSGGTIQEFSIKGISILPFLIKKKLAVASVILKHPFILYASHQKRNPVEKSGSNDHPIHEVQIDLIRVDSGRVEMADSSSCAITLSAKINFQVDKLSVTNFSTDSMTWKVQGILAKAVTVDLPTRFYHFTLQQFAYYYGDKQVRLDSIELLPTLERGEFARKSGQQVDQFTLVMPSLVVNDFEMSQTVKPSFIAREVMMQFNLEVFRDKRYARAWKKPKVLPVAFLHSLNFPLRIDSLRIMPSNIIYEEHPEKGEGTGKVSFNALTAGIYNISNDSTGESVMKVHTRFMKTGDLDVNFTFPLEKRKLYAVKGSLVNFPMKDLNTMLEPVAKIKVETGHLQAMKFDFWRKRTSQQPGYPSGHLIPGFFYLARTAVNPAG